MQGAQADELLGAAILPLQDGTASLVPLWEALLC